MNNKYMLDIVELKKRVRYSPESPSGLVWNEDHGGIRNKIYKEGDVAGRKTDFGYLVGIFGITRTCSRIVYFLHNPEIELLDKTMVVNHIDGDVFNNKIDNLEYINIKDLRKKVVNKNRLKRGLSESEFLDKKEWAKRYREQNAEKIKSLNSKWREDNKTEIAEKATVKKSKNLNRVMWQSAKERALKRNLNFSITPEDIKIPEFCPILGIRLQRNTGGASENSPSLDRIVPDIGYIPENIWVISHLANSMKNNADKYQLLAFASWVLEEYLD